MIRLTTPKAPSNSLDMVRLLFQRPMQLRTFEFAKPGLSGDAPQFFSDVVQLKAPNAAGTLGASCSSYEPSHSTTVAILLQPYESVPNFGSWRPWQPKG